MKRFFRQNFLIFLISFVAACSSKDDIQPQIRIVDLNGNSHSVVTKVPELNMQAMAMQGHNPEPVKIFNQGESFENVPKSPSYSNLIEQTLNLPQDPKAELSAQNQAEVITPDPKFKMPESQETIEYDLVSPQEDLGKNKISDNKEENPSKSNKKITVSSNKLKGLFVQVGSFSNEDSAKEVLRKMSSFHKGRIEVSDDERKLYRVLLGPFKTKPAAQKTLNKIVASGHEAVLKRNR